MGLDIGFDDVGIAPAGPHPEMSFFEEWLNRGYHGEMKYMFRHRRRRMNPDRTLRGVKNVIVCAYDYNTDFPLSTEVSDDPGRGWVSRYAWGDDYHDVMEPMLTAWVERLRSAAPGYSFRHYVDHGPVLEKVFARYAGIGWMGKNTNIIHPKRGSYFFLAVILTDLEMAVDTPLLDHCGSCTACLDACPTDAFVTPYVLDARRCLSYANIEEEGAVSTELADGLGSNVYGCDICQDVCPWNRKPEAPNRPEFQPRQGLFNPLLAELSSMDDEVFSERFDGSPIQRRGRVGLQAVVNQVVASNDSVDGDS
jgi:epoxyqueuosine reductase